MEVKSRLGRRGKRHRGNDDLISLFDADRLERQVKRCRAGIDGYCMPNAKRLGESMLELGHLGPRGQPARPQRMANRRDLLLANGRKMERQKGPATSAVQRCHIYFNYVNYCTRKCTCFRRRF